MPNPNIDSTYPDFIASIFLFGIFLYLFKSCLYVTGLVDTYSQFIKLNGIVIQINKTNKYSSSGNQITKIQSIYHIYDKFTNVTSCYVTTLDPNSVNPVGHVQQIYLDKESIDYRLLNGRCYYSPTDTHDFLLGLVLTGFFLMCLLIVVSIGCISIYKIYEKRFYRLNGYSPVSNQDRDIESHIELNHMVRQ